MVRIRTACTAIVLLLAACGGAGVGAEGTTEEPTSTTPAATSPSVGGSSSTTPSASGESSTTSTSQAAISTAPTTTPTTTTDTGQDEGMTVPPSLIQSVIADLATREGVEPGEVGLLSTGSVDWPDASLGCPVAGVSYMQVVTPGYQIILGIGEKTFDYRAIVNGSFRLCRNPPAGSSSPSPDS
ncbi:MAG: hypothetical protein WD156_00315 [Acidimicrobiia bacterium]